MEENKLSVWQKTALTLLRIFIGWHFLYEGVLKVHHSEWTAKSYLLSAYGPFEGLFTWMANDAILPIINTLNVFGLLLIGLALVLGYFERLAAIGGIVLLLFYYLSHPSFPGFPQPGTEGSYWIINKNLIEAVALWVIYQLPTAGFFGLESLSAPTKKHVESNPPVHHGQ